MFCRVCGQPLTDAISVGMGIGPVCRLSVKEAEAANPSMSLFSGGAGFSVEMARNTICLIDLDSGMSLTQDVRTVLREVQAQGLDIDAHPVIYRDVVGIWDEIVVERGQFAGFRSLGETDRDTAIARRELAGSAIKSPAKKRKQPTCGGK